MLILAQASIMQTYDSSSEVQVLMKNIWDDYGPQLSYILVMNIGGRAARSDLDVIAEPLKKLVYHQPRAKTWLSDALSNSDFPSQNVGATEKRMWLEKIIK